MYVCQLPQEEREAILKQLQKALPAEEIEIAMNSKVVDLEEILER